jgi:tryptophanyl-tRNA synthetase
LYSTVQAMDIFISTTQKLPVNEDQYKLCAVTCLLVSAKSFERDDLIPKTP